MRFHPGLVLTFVLIFFTSNGIMKAGTADGPDLGFYIKHYTNGDGLPQNSVNDIVRDQFGYMWFATGNGLSRFDGYTFRNFNKPTLPSNLVHALAVSPDKRVWIGTSQGLCYFDLLTEKIEKFPLISGKERRSVQVPSLFCDAEGRLWVGTSDSGLFLLSPSAQGYRTEHYDTSNSKLPGNNIPVVAQLRNGNILVGTNHGAAIRCSDATQFELWHPEHLQNSVVLSFCETKEGQIFVGNVYGLALFPSEDSMPQWFFPDPFNPAALSHARVNAIMQDSQGQILIGTLGGIDLFQSRSASFYHLPQGQSSHFSLNSQFVRCLTADDQGNIWVGTEKGGINQMNVHQKPFKKMQHLVDNVNSLSSSTINSILVEGDDYWIGTAEGGLNHFNASTGKFKYFKYDAANAASISSNYVAALVKVPGGELWLGTWGGGICKLCSNGTFKRFSPPIDNPETNFVNNFISSLVYDKRGYLWIGTEGGLAILDLHTETFLKPNISVSSFEISEIGCLYLSSKDILWVGTRKGLYRFPANVVSGAANGVVSLSNIDVFSSRADSSLPSAMAGDYVISLLEDDDNTMWVGTYGDGLLKCVESEQGKITFEHYSSEHGLCNNVVYAIQKDNFDNLWLSTDHGLSQFNPVSLTFSNFFKEDGLLGDQFYWSASFKSSDGRLFFGGVDGLNYFKPSEFSAYPLIPKVAITAVRVFNLPVSLGQERHGRPVMKHSPAVDNHISLSYKDNVFAIEFSALDFFHPEKIQYAYKLEGVDNDWVKVASSQRLANYTNLVGGDYLFKVKASNSDGQWSDEVTELHIHIRPPFWQTKWFQLLMVFVVILAAIGYSRFHSRRLIMQKTKLEAKVLERTQQIEKQSEELRHVNQVLEHRQSLIEGQKNELESKNEEIIQQRDHVVDLNKEIERINQLRIRFFTNISHEFRTPLTLIVAPIDRLMNDPEFPVSFRSTLNVIHRNARRLHLLIDQLLTFRKIEEGKLKVMVSQGNISDFVQEVVTAFNPLALQRKIDYSFHDQWNGQPCWFDREKVENLLYNLLSNAFKYTAEGEKVAVSLRSAAMPSSKGEIQALVIEVMDTGRGIAEDQQSRIFESFYRVPSNGDINGTGIGLSLVAELVVAMNGNISLRSKVGEGSCFTVMLPCRVEDLGNAELPDHFAVDPLEIENKVQVIQDSFNEEDHFLSEFDTNAPASKPCMVIVEDNTELREFLSDSFGDAFNVYTAENGRIGYNLVRKHIPEVVLSDVMMPETDGIELCKLIKNNLYTSHIPVILLTAKAMVENQLEGLQTGADDYIPKPFSLEVLGAKIHNLVDSRAKLRAKFCARPDNSPLDSAVSSLDEKFLSKAYDVLEQYYQNPDFSVEQFADLMFVSRSLLYKKIKVLVNLSPNDFITVFRLKKSTALLSDKSLTINEVAYRIGFNDPKYFSRVFKKFYSKTPSDYTIG